MKTVEDLTKELETAERMAQEKQIEIALLKEGIDPEKVAMRDFDRIRRLARKMTEIEQEAEERIAEINRAADIEISKLSVELESLSNEIKAKLAESEVPATA